MKCDCVLPNLFIGPDPRDEADFEQLQAMKITVILSLQSEDDVNTSEVLSRRKAATQRALTIYNVPVVDFDRADLRRKLRDCVGALDNLLRQEKSSQVGMHAKRLKAGWDNAYLQRVLEGGN